MLFATGSEVDVLHTQAVYCATRTSGVLGLTFKRLTGLSRAAVLRGREESARRGGAVQWS